MGGLRKNKKGSIQDIIYVATILLVFAIVILIVFKVSDELNSQFQTDPTIEKYDSGSRARNAMGSINNMFPNVIDNSFLFLVVGLAIVAFVLAAMVRVHPVFFIFFLLILVIIIFLCGVFSNIYQEIAEQTELASLANQLVFTTNILRLLPFIVGTFGMILALIMYKTWQNQ